MGWLGFPKFDSLVAFSLKEDQDSAAAEPSSELPLVTQKASEKVNARPRGLKALKLKF